jgi:hypothetical protein
MGAVGRHHRRLVLIDVALGQLDAVDEDVAAVNIDRVAADADDPLDQGRSGRVLDPARRRVEDDDIPRW